VIGSGHRRATRGDPAFQNPLRGKAAVNLRRFFADLISRVCFPAVSKTSGDFADPLPSVAAP